MNLWHAAIALLPFDWAHYAFMRNALLAIVIISPVLALLGSMIVNKQMAFFSDAIGHATLAGIAIGTLAGLDNPMAVMIGFSCLLAGVITLMRRFGSASTDTVISVTMSFCAALGIVLLSRNGGFTKYSRYLIGDVLSITNGEIVQALIVSALFMAVWLVFFNTIVLVSINHSLARSRRIPIWLVETLFAVITAVIVTVCIPWVGILVISALIVLPAATARNLARSTRQYLFAAACIGIVSGIAGLIASYYWATATGATMVLIAAGFYAVSLVVKAAALR